MGDWDGGAEGNPMDDLYERGNKIAVSSTILSGWKWRQHTTTAEEAWQECAHSNPTTEIFTDLLDAKRIPHPFLDENEKLVQHVGEADWEYTCDVYHDGRDAHTTQHIVFEGLDTIASVFLNDQPILESTNMFHVHRIDVTDKIRHGLNVLRILFRSAVKYGKALEASNGHYRAFNGDHTRTHVRKAQYHYGWDWGPVLMTCGPYREIRLESFAAAIADVFVDAQVSQDLQEAKVRITFDATLSQDAIVKVKLSSPNSQMVQGKTRMQKIDKAGEVALTIASPELWFPIGYGPQTLYDVEIDLTTSDGIILQSVHKSVGMRRVRFVEQPLDEQEGTSFFFEVNNISIYSCGVNWIPGHSFLTAMTAADYSKTIKSAVDAHQNMIRVWGGGVYEPDCFYEECDRLGVLVWQDFMFACSRYPAYPTFIKSVAKEATDQVKRLRNFCSVIVYAGNNEDYAIAEILKLTWDKDDKSGDYTSTDFPARTIYEDTLSSIVERYSPGVPYRFGSPWGGETTEDPTIGDTHQWNVWHGTQEKYQLWDKLVSRFVSEFGMLGFPSTKTIRKFVTDPRQMYPQSSVLDHHNKADGSERRLALYVMENLRVDSMNLESWVYATQLMQAECLAFAYRSCRRQWKGPNKEYCGGNLVWQINDCWPTQSWSLIDFYGDRKLAYYAVKRESAPVCLGINRTTAELKALKTAPEFVMGPPHDLSTKKYIFDIWAVNMNLDIKTVRVEVRQFNIMTGMLSKETFLESVELASNRTTEIAEDLVVDSETAIQARMIDRSGAVIARMSDWPQPLKHVMQSEVAANSITVTVNDGEVMVQSAFPLKGVELYYTKEDRTIEWDDNGFDVFPHDIYHVKAPGLLKGDEVKFRCYGWSL